MLQIGKQFFTDTYVFTGVEKARSAVARLQQYTKTPTGHATTAATAPATTPSVGPTTLHLRMPQCRVSMRLLMLHASHVMDVMVGQVMYGSIKHSQQHLRTCKGC